VVEQKRGRRPTILVADTTTARAKVRTLEATIRLEVRTKLLNPKWFEGMLEHGYQGVEEIRKRLDYAFGFSATAEAVDSWVYEAVFATYVADPALRERMRELNIHAYDGLLRRLSEAGERGFWQPADDQTALLEEICNEIEDRLEGVG
jgi:magnesium chelatase subunit H